MLIQYSFTLSEFFDPLEKFDSIGMKGYIGGALLSAFLKVMRTKWECTPKLVTDHIGVHSKKKKGPYQSALQNARGTIWECTP